MLDEIFPFLSQYEESTGRAVIAQMILQLVVFLICSKLVSGKIHRLTINCFN